VFHERRGLKELSCERFRMKYTTPAAQVMLRTFTGGLGDGRHAVAAGAMLGIAAVHSSGAVGGQHCWADDAAAFAMVDVHADHPAHAGTGEGRA
jgi:hypothetical protein